MKVLIDTNIIIDGLTGREPFREAAEKIFILASGSIFNLVLAITSFNFLAEMKEELFFTNVFIAIFNLLPIIPLDGGNILICVLNIILNIINIDME